MRYHSLHPDYIHNRLKSLGKQYGLRVLLVLVDTVSMIIMMSCLHHCVCVCVFILCVCVCVLSKSESQKVLHELAKIALLTDLTLVLSWRLADFA